MAARRSSQTSRDNTPMMRQAERLPLRNLQIETLGQKCSTFSATKPISTIGLKKEGKMAKLQADILPDCPPTRSTSTSVTSHTQMGLTKQNVAAIAEDEGVFQKVNHDFPATIEIDERLETCELQSITDARIVQAQSENPWDVESVQVKSDPMNCLNDSSTSCVDQTSTEDSAVECCTDYRVGDVIFKSFLCNGVEVEISNTSWASEETVLPLTQCAAEDRSCGLFQGDYSESLSFSQCSDLKSSNGHKDHAYGLLERDDCCSRDEILTDGVSVMETPGQKDHPYVTTDTSQGLLVQHLECLENMQEGSPLCPLQKETGSYSAVEQDTAAQSLTADQSQDRAAQSLTADQSQYTAEQCLTADQSLDTAEQCLTADQSQDRAAQSLTADQSQYTAEQCLTADQSLDTAEQCLNAYQSLDTAEQCLNAYRSLDTAEQCLTADRSLDTAEQCLTADRSLDTAEQCLTADRSLDTAEQCLTADRSLDTAEQCLTAEQSLDTAEQCLTADQSQDTAEQCLSADQSQDTAEQCLSADQSLDTAEQCLSADQSQDTAEQCLTADRSLDTAEQCLNAYRSLDTAEQCLTADQSLDTAEQCLSADRSQDTAEQCLTADRSLDTAEQCLTADRSLDTAEQCLTADRSLDTAEQCLTADQSLDTAEQCLTADKSQEQGEQILIADQSQDTSVQSLTSECRVCEKFTFLLTAGTEENSSCCSPSSVKTQTPALTSSICQRQLAHGFIRDTWSPVGDRESRLFMENLESPLPLLNSTLITSIMRSVACTPHAREAISGVLAPHAENVVGTRAGTLQELLESQAPTNLAGTQMGPQQSPGYLAGTQSGPLQEQLRHMGELLLRASKNMVPAVEHRSTSTWTRAVQMTEHGVNTSGLFERKKELSVTDVSTSTDSLLRNLATESLAELSRQDLEERLFSTLIVVEALCQQVASARAHSQSSGPRPSDFRDKLVQTDHTELSQGMIYRELYVKAVERIQALELDQDQQRRLLQELKNSSITMTAITTENEEALSRVNEMATITSEDQKRISEQMCRMRGLYGRFRETLRRKMEEGTQLCIQKKNMEQQMKEALRVKEAALTVLEQLRSHHAVQVAELEQSVGSHLELIPVLSNTYQEQVALNEEYVESLQAADELLKETMCDQARMYEELSKAQRLLQRTQPVMLKLHEKAAAALQARNQQQQETNQMQTELEQSTSHLHDAQQQIGDLNLQLTIVTSEMAVLRQRLDELEEERAQAEMRSTKLSATLSSTEASCTYLQQALNAETHRLEVMSGESSQRVEVLGRALSEKELQLTQAQRHLLELQRQLSNTCEINEFLQTENELSREQVAESEVLVKSHLQGLRARNLECEDLKQALCELQLQRDSLQEELFSTQNKARSMLLDMGEQLALASTEITLLHHKVHTLTSTVKATLTTQKPESSSKKVHLPAAPPRATVGSFVDTIMVASAVEEAPASETEECHFAALGSGNSAFTRVPTTTPKKDAEEQSNVLELLSGLGEAVSELVHTMDQLRELRPSQCDELQHTVASLQEELHSLTLGHRAQVADLKKQVTHLQAKVEKDVVAVQRKAQEEEALRELQKSENKELRRNVSELQNLLQQAQLEVQILKEECGQSAQRMPALEEKIRLQKEVDKLRRSLSETEDSRSKLLDRAKRHQLVHETNQRKLETELQALDQMIETVRKTLSSLPLVVKDYEELKKLVAYLG